MCLGLGMQCICPPIRTGQWFPPDLNGFPFQLIPLNCVFFCINETENVFLEISLIALRFERS